jgi:glycine/serine hydroxymethyltransferase
MATVVSFIDKVLMNADNESVILEVKKQVNQMMEGFPLYK